MAPTWERPLMQSRGSRDDLITTLEKDAEAYHYLANDKLGPCLKAIKALRDGERSVTVGHTIYTVDDGTTD
jgi:hypothetical protein